MAENGSECTLTDTQIVIINSIYVGLSVVSLIIGLMSLLLNRCYHHRYKDTFQSDPIEGIFLLVLIGCSMFGLCESFQWFVQLKDFIGCAVLGPVRQYIIVSSLVIITCLGIHLLIIMAQPKFLQVIMEVKRKRYKILQQFYFIITFLVPLFFVPWPYITTQYGNTEFVCWLTYSNSCDTSDAAATYLLTNILVWQLWGALVWLFTVGVVVLASYRYCVHWRTSTVRRKPNSDINTIIALLVAFVLQAVANLLPIVWRTATKQYSFPITLQVAVLTPLTVMVYSLIVDVRQVYIIATRPRESVTLGSVATCGRSYDTTSQTYFRIPDNEW